MAEFLGQKKRPRTKAEEDGFANMGKPIPFFRQQNGYEHCKQMGLSSADAHEVVNVVSEQLARDQPYEAMAAGMRFLDLTGTYRLFAVLLVSNNPAEQK